MARESLTRVVFTHATLALVGGAFLVGFLPAGATMATAEPEPMQIDLYAINDFHGRVEAERGVPGAASLAGAIGQFRSENPHTAFVSAGDNIGASTFTSFISDDAPTIDALLAAGLDVSAVGNHEFDRGYADLSGRVLPRYGDPKYGLGANVTVSDTGAPALQPYEILDIGGVRVGFIATVTEQTATSVTPELVRDLTFGSQLDAANRFAEEIDDLVDITVLLAHDGSFAQDCATISAEQSVFGRLVREASPKIDAIFSGHTHTPYSCTIAGRPVVQAGSFGAFLSHVAFDVDPLTNTLLDARSDLIPLTDATGAPTYPAAPGVTQIVDDAVRQADFLGTAPVGRIGADIVRGGTPPGSDRGVESQLGNLIADVMTWAVPSADLGLINPGGLRTDLFYRDDGTLNFREVASVQPFANTLVTVELTGDQLRRVLEQQWYLSGGAELKRHLGVSDGFRYTYLPGNDPGARIVSMSLNGAPIDPARQYTVVTISFLAGGGDGFSTFTESSKIVDTGRNDLQATIDYFADVERRGEVVMPPRLGRASVTNVPDGGGNGGGDGDGNGDSDAGGEPGGSGSGGSPTDPTREHGTSNPKLAATGATSDPTIVAATAGLAVLGGLVLLSAASLNARRG